jgi:hypothetical protein
MAFPGQLVAESLNRVNESFCRFETFQSSVEQVLVVPGTHYPPQIVVSFESLDYGV